jgi:hypothetical protein
LQSAGRPRRPACRESAGASGPEPVPWARDGVLQVLYEFGNARRNERSSPTL